MGQPVLMMITMAGFSRLHHMCKIQKLMMIYFKSCGIVTKALDTLHTLSITMSQKWLYDGIEALLTCAREDMAHDVKTYPWFGSHDNVNIPFRVYQQRLDNQSHFDSGTAGTIVVITDPACTPPRFTDLKPSLVKGGKNLITFQDILDIDQASCQCLDVLATHIILGFLLDTPEFQFDKYKHKASPVFTHPSPTLQLHAFQEMATRQYMLDLLHIKEASYEGNDKVLSKWFRIAHVDPTGQQLLIWVRDQLTVGHIQGLKKFCSMDLNSFNCLKFIVPVFGWFHAQIAMEYSLHLQYYGTRKGHGLVHTFDLLKHKGLHSPLVQEMYHQNIKEALNHIATACFHDLWCTVAKVNNLGELKDQSLEVL